MKRSAVIPEFMLTGEVARRLGVSQVTVRTWVAEGKIAAHVTRGGTFLLFDPAEVERVAALQEESQS